MIISASGIRGVPNKDVTVQQLAGFARDFFDSTGSERILLARDTRRTGAMLARAATGALLSHGATVLDAGVVSTPALFRESRVTGLPGIMISASHNEPEFNGLKFVHSGLGVQLDTASGLAATNERRPFREGGLKRLPRVGYVDDLAKMFGRDSCSGVRVAVDLGGGAAITHVEQLLKRLGCPVEALNDTYGVFGRRVDPMNDELTLLRRVVKEKDCDIGLGFDCDGDRLAVVDSKGNKRSGDYMLSLALSRRLRDLEQKRVVVSVDTTQAVDEIVAEFGGEVYRSKVGEANVVGMMRVVGATIGGEGSSGGLIDGSYNWCRDSMLAALTIISSLKSEGRKAYDSVKSYHQVREAMPLSRAKAARAIKAITRKTVGADTRDGVKIWASKKSWVLIRPSGTEDLVRVSAEAETLASAKRLVDGYSRTLKGLGK